MLCNSRETRMFYRCWHKKLPLCKTSMSWRAQSKAFPLRDIKTASIAWPPSWPASWTPSMHKFVTRPLIYIFSTTGSTKLLMWIYVWITFWQLWIFLFQYIQNLIYLSTVREKGNCWLLIQKGDKANVKKLTFYQTLGKGKKRWG